MAGKADNKKNKSRVTAKGQGTAGTRRAGAGLYASSGGGVSANTRGRVRDSGRYNGRVGANPDFPNKRKKITTGRELTTPVTRRALEARKRKYRIAAKEKTSVKYSVVKTKGKKLPLGMIVSVVVFFGLLMLLMFSYMAVHNKNMDIDKLKRDIAAEERREQYLQREFDIKAERYGVIDYAVNKLGMVKEETLPKSYLTSETYDKATVIKAANGEFKGIKLFNDIFSAFFN
ncbi:MAG: hypothetical protein FWH10_04525 [Oscillospiraceae bacterium]|nr:hypothetical protein [Oscillospiraceae bacterium]